MESNITVKKFSVPAWLRLTLISLVAAVSLAATNLLTKDIIALHASEHTQMVMAALVPGASSFVKQTLAADSPLQNLTVAKKGDDTLAYIATSVKQGYAGPIEILTAVDTNHVILGISVGGSEFAETAGLGSLAKEEPFTSQYIGLSAPITLSKEGGDNTIDAISGATITSTAVTDGVNESIAAIKEAEQK